MITLSWCGANFGGATMTQAPSTAGDELSALSVIVAVTGPSETSSYQSPCPRSAIQTGSRRGGRLAGAAQHEQMVRVVAADLAERHGPAPALANWMGRCRKRAGSVR